MEEVERQLVPGEIVPAVVRQIQVEEVRSGLEQGAGEWLEFSVS